MNNISSKNILILLLIIINLYFIFDEISMYLKNFYKDKFSNINNYNIDCYIIHLERSKDRISNIKKQQTKTELNIQYFNAVDANDLNKDTLIKDKILDPSYANISRVEHYGCFLSHVNVLKQIGYNYENNLSKSKYTLVLEDDFNIIDNNFDNNLSKIIKDIEKIKYNFDIIFIGNKGDDKIYDKNIINNI
jgi:GR25 family glycosyltransferase involved in LPS biosynthesis